MKHPLTVTAVLAVLVGVSAAADTPNHLERPTCYFAGPGIGVNGVSGSPYWHMGASAQHVGPSGVGWTVEVGYFTAQSSLFNGGHATLAGGGLYHFGRGRTNGPFVVAGCGLEGLGVFQTYSQIGGGYDVWGSGRWGLRLEALARAYEWTRFTYVQFRVGFLN